MPCYLVKIQKAQEYEIEIDAPNPDEAEKLARFREADLLCDDDAISESIAVGEIEELSDE